MPDAQQTNGQLHVNTDIVSLQSGANVTVVSPGSFSPQPGPSGLQLPQQSLHGHLKDFNEDNTNYGRMEPYEPDMNAIENPHYYHINELLFNAHRARSHRHTDIVRLPPHQ